MLQQLESQTQLQIAAIVFPIIALVVSFAIDSVEDEGWKYRAFVGSFGIAAVTPALVVVILAITGSILGFTSDSILGFLLLSFFVTTFLVLGVLLHEVLKGLEEENDQLYVLTAILSSVLVLAIFVRFIL